MSQWIQISLKQKITKFSLIDSWIVRQFKDEYNPVHWHGGHVSGAGFLKIPKSFGSQFFLIATTCLVKFFHLFI